MELTDSTDQKKSPQQKTTPSLTAIDLNETLSSSSSQTLPPNPFAVVRSFHRKPNPPPGPPAGFPGDTDASTCVVCGLPEVGEHLVVCDGCERGFHIGCAGMRGGPEEVMLEEWMCGECVGNREPSNRWPLGLKSKASGQKRSRVRLLDFNYSFLSDGEVSASEDFPVSRKHTPGDNSFGGNPIGDPVTDSKSLYVGNGFRLPKASGIVTHAVKLTSEDILHHKHLGARSFEADMHSLLGRLRRNSNHTTRQPSQNLSEKYLHALKEFISEKHGVLEEGWCVVFKPSMDSGELHAVYRSPEGKAFNSMPDVACHLGLMSDIKSVEPKARNNGSALLQKSSHLADTLSYASDLAGKFEANAEAMGARPGEISGIGHQQFNDGLPIQYEDFFVLSLGKVSARSSYHTVNQIWPVGYRSCWHDKITGSLFICNVQDGGDSGPIFKVSRCSCSTMSIPTSSVLLFTPNLGEPVGEKKGKNDDVSMDYDEYCGVQMLLSDASLPMENDILSCLGSSSDNSFNVQTSNCLQFEHSSLQEGLGNALSDYSVLSDEIGEFSVEELSPSSAWRMVSKKFSDACHQIYMQKGTLKFFCKHVENGTSLALSDCSDEKDERRCTSLARFFGSSRSIKIPSVTQDGFETVFKVLVTWLDQDRFGLDAEFVQEIIEQLPGVYACSQYVLLKERNCYTSSVTVGNGFLMVRTKDGVQAKNVEALDALFRGCKRGRTEMVEDPMIESSCFPPGKPISSKLPLEIVGHFLQVWEFLWRFYDVLGLEDSLSIEELEAELICPWFDGLNFIETFVEKIQESRDITSPTDGSSRHILFSSTESGPTVTMENPHTFIEMQPQSTREATQTRINAVTYGRCTAIGLTNVHCFLLKVLIVELQTKVSAIIDPKFDTGESKPKRCKKKDMDYSVASKFTKLNMLPINELTWPELARRYILTVLSMDGNIDSPEITIRESGKVFRLLQGDGGVPCGSLTGVLAMEADALLLAQAMKKIFGYLNRENDMLSIDDGESDAMSACKSITNGNIPEWARLLEPVRKLPTNVGARIRKCVYSALEKGPPEWAKKILEHSISKEVYKGNASGPTKKAVLSVLADVDGEQIQKPVKERKIKNYMSISVMIMKQCRIVLRRVANADNAKVFCNLLGRKLIIYSDNNDEGILGSPAMVSRPLDFRTIDLRLAAGAYGGCHEAFLEDVRELWTHIRIAFGDKPDLIQLAETLSSNFEALYEKEVVIMFRKFVGYAKLGCLTAESKKEIDDFLVSLSELPKAPWEDGVCKVCGVDKDDDSVLLCDTCDAEYHTYCLNPPLARIPQGNWYCPSCVANNKCNVQDASEGTSITCCHQRKYHGEVTSVYLDALKQLASVLEGKEYWELSVDERTLLLKFLCDDLLNSTLVRHHLEHCMELSADLQQKLRSVSMELRNLKYKEEILAANVTKADECAPFSHLEEKKSAGNSPITEPLDANDRYRYVQPVGEGSQVSGNFSPHLNILKKELLPSNILQQKINDLSKEKDFQSGMKKYEGMDVSTQSFSEDQRGLRLPLDLRSSQIGEDVPSNALTESQASILELNSVRNEISLLQDSISSMEMQLMKLSARREFLGSDSAGRLYWVMSKLDRHPWLIVNHSEMTLQQGASGSGASCPHTHDLYNANTPAFPWVSYQSDAEIKELVKFMRDDDPKERELKVSILHWLKQGFKETKQIENQGQGEPQMASSVSANKRNSTHYESLITKAASLLENKYGPWFKAEAIDFLKKRRTKGKLITEDKMFRCNCLEPVWPSRHHCLSCHRTFLTEVELEGHDNAMCKLGLPISKKSKGISALKSKGMMTGETVRGKCTGGMDTVEASKSGYYELNSNLVTYQNDRCPYDFDEICSKFVIKNSIKESVQEIGLLGTNGVPMFVPSVSPYLSDPTLMLVPPKREVRVSCEEPKIDEQGVLNQGMRMTTNVGHDTFSNIIPRRCAANELTGAFNSDKAVFGPLGQKSENLSALEVGNCCVIPESALRPLVGRASQILRRLKINLLDMDAALPEVALRPAKAHLERRWAWRAFVKSAENIHEMVLAVIAFEDMIKTQYLSNNWWYWSSLSAAAKTSTLSSLGLRIYSLDASIDYEKNSSDLAQRNHKPGQNSESVLDATETIKLGKKLKRKSVV